MLAQTVPEWGVVRSREPFKFWWAPTISLERLIVSGAVNLGGRTVSLVNWWWYRSPVYHTDRLHLCTARWAWGTASRGSVSGSGDLYYDSLSYTHRTVVLSSWLCHSRLRTWPYKSFSTNNTRLVRRQLKYVRALGCTVDRAKCNDTCVSCV